MATPLDDFGSTVAGAYPDLRAIAAAYLSRERRFHTLGPTELVHEGILKQFPNGEYSELTPADFMNRIAHAMRLVLVDHARRRNALKRGGSAATTILDESLLAYEKSAIDVLALDEALDRLERLDRELALIVELRFFAGLTEIEIARELDISLSSVARGWRFARLWLARELGGGG